MRQCVVQRFTAAATGLLLMTVSSSLAAYTVTAFGGAAYDPDTAAMDAGLGIDAGFAVEDFEDLTLLPILTVEYTNPDQAPIGVLPNLYTQPEQFDDNYWDGNSALLNTPDNLNWNARPGGIAGLAQAVTFHVGGAGARAFGIGFGNLQADNVDHQLLVNGAVLIPALEGLAPFVSGINIRNLYLVVEQEAGDAPIASVGIDIGISGPGADGMVFDHVAIKPVPVPAAAWLFGSALVALRMRRARIHQAD